MRICPHPQVDPTRQVPSLAVTGGGSFQFQALGLGCRDPPLISSKTQLLVLCLSLHYCNIQSQKWGGIKWHSEFLQGPAMIQDTEERKCLRKEGLSLSPPPLHLPFAHPSIPPLLFPSLHFLFHFPCPLRQNCGDCTIVSTSCGLYLAKYISSTKSWSKITESAEARQVLVLRPVLSCKYWELWQKQLPTCQQTCIPGTEVTRCAYNVCLGQPCTRSHQWT